MRETGGELVHEKLTAGVEKNYVLTGLAAPDRVV